MADTALLLQVLAGEDTNDPMSAAQLVPDYTAALADPQPPRIGLVREFFLEKADAETQQHIEAVVEQLTQGPVLMSPRWHSRRASKASLKRTSG